MFFWHMVTAFVVAALLAVLLTATLGRRGPGPWAGFVFFFVLLFLATWAGGLWVLPWRPMMWGGVPWLSFLVVGVLVALLLAALLPGRVAEAPPVETREPTAAESAVAGVGLAVGVFFWLLMLGLVVAIVVNYIAMAT